MDGTGGLGAAADHLSGSRWKVRGSYPRAVLERPQQKHAACPGPGTLEERIAVGATLLKSGHPEQLDVHFDVSKVDLWSYSYKSVQRPLVRVREEITEEVKDLYWRFEEQYGDQIGVGPGGDRVNEIKFQYGGLVMRGPAVDGPQYAIYGSLFIEIPEGGDAVGGSRTFPPFQGNGGGPSGGPIMTLGGQEIDLFIYLTGVRPGSVLEVGDVFSLAGAIGPPLPAKLSYTVAPPTGPPRAFTGQANRVGYYYDPSDDFVVEEPGPYLVDLQVLFDSTTSAGLVTEPFPTGSVLGAADGSFVVYVVTPDSPLLSSDQPEHTVVRPEQLPFEATVKGPGGSPLQEARATVMMPGFRLDEKELAIQNGAAHISYSPFHYNQVFTMLDNDLVDVITISLFGRVAGGALDGYAARVLTLHGPDLFNLDPVKQFIPTTCVPGPETACLFDGLFKVEGSMQNFANPPVDFTTRVMSFPGSRAESDQAVFFESFDAGNFEVGVKMVNGCGFPEGHSLHNYWAFFGGLTNAATEMRITDTVTGQVYSWSNPARSFPQTLGDTAAFPCIAGAPVEACVGGEETACLIGGRFRVEGEMTSFADPPEIFPTRVMSFPSGRAESTQAVFFESFNVGNFEVGVKMVDGCGFPPGHPLHFYWVFYGGLTNAATRITTTQTTTGLEDEWINSARNLPLSVGRTQAFRCD